MNKDGTAKNLVVAHPGNTNAVRHGAHSSQLIQANATAIEAELFHSYRFSPIEQIAIDEVSALMAMAKMIDRHLEERGPVDKKGNPSYLIDKRLRISRQLEQWIPQVRGAIERQAGEAQDSAAIGRSDYVRELQRIALGRDTSAGARDRLVALAKLVDLDERGSAGASLRPDDIDAEIERILSELSKRRIGKQMAEGTDAT